MRFLIFKTSDWSDKQPCEEARLEEYTDDNGEIRKGWFIHINSLQELINFKNKFNHPLIIEDYFLNPDVLAIEVYDDWRE